MSEEQGQFEPWEPSEARFHPVRIRPRALGILPRRTRTRLRAIVENTNDAIIMIDTSSTIRFANTATEDLFGYPPDELDDGFCVADDGPGIPDGERGGTRVEITDRRGYTIGSFGLGLSQS